MNDQPIGGGGEENNSRRRQVVAPPQNQPHPPPPPPPQSCPRCNSTNTKFCYYNNYSLSQPRYFCKGCRRYWTQGGTLRNVPVGGGCRKSKRPKLSSAAATSSAAASTSQSQAAADVNPAAALVGSTVNYNNNPFYGGGFLGPNLSLLHGFSLPSFDHQPPPPPPLQPPQHNQEPPPFQPFFPIRQGPPTTSSGDWNPNIDHNSNQWHDFTGGSGLDDP